MSGIVMGMKVPGFSEKPLSERDLAPVPARTVRKEVIRVSLSPAAAHAEKLRAAAEKLRAAEVARKAKLGAVTKARPVTQGWRPATSVWAERQREFSAQLAAMREHEGEPELTMADIARTTLGKSWRVLSDR